MPPPSRNHRTPMLGKTPASTAAFSLDAPRAIASQNLTRCSRRPAGGRPLPRVPAAAARSHAPFFLGNATPQRRALRRPVEFTPSAAGDTAETPLLPISRIDRRQIQRLIDQLRHEPRQMPIRYPVLDRRRHQQHLPWWYARNVFTAPTGARSATSASTGSTS